MVAFFKVGCILKSLSWKKLLSPKPLHIRSRMSFRLSDSTVDSNTSEEYYNSIKIIQEFIPKLTSNLHKGECGRIGVIGGSFKYTGAPYFAAISSLRLGADLVHVFCCRDAATAIKSYSPELIVHPLLDSQTVVEEIQPWLGVLHALVIGPGLGRDSAVMENVEHIITHCKEKLNPSLPLIIDADGLHLICNKLSLIANYKGPIILTPNAVEFSRLVAKLSIHDTCLLASTLNALIVEKGVKDIITNGIYGKMLQVPRFAATLNCDIPGSNRRCGGQGDILAGCIAVFIGWLQIYFKKQHFDFNRLEASDKDKLKNFQEQIMNYTVAVYGACIITRTSSRLAFEQFGRGMTATDIIPFIPKAFQLHFGV